MQTQALQLQVSPTIGHVSAEYTLAENNLCIMTLAHGAGAGMHHPFMVALSQKLAAIGIATLRFNFPFTEHNKRRADVPAVAHQTIQAAIDHAHKNFPLLPLYVSGKSFGGRMSSQLLALNPSAVVKGLVFYGFPLHPAGKPSIDRATHLKDLLTPTLFLQGTRDELATLNLLEPVCSSLPLATLVKIEGADHGFKAGKKDIVQVLAEETKEWVLRINERG